MQTRLILDDPQSEHRTVVSEWLFLLSKTIFCLLEIATSRMHSDIVAENRSVTQALDNCNAQRDEGSQINSHSSQSVVP